MRKNIFFAAVICLLTAAVFLSVPGSAADVISARLPFSVRNASGTVEIEALGGAPLPDPTVCENVTDGAFTVSFREADTYHYRVYQRPGSAEDVEYDATVYEVTVTVLAEKDGSMSAVITVNKEGDTHKLTANDVVFENRKAEPDIPPEPQKDGGMPIWPLPAALAFSLVCIIVLISVRVRKKAGRGK